MVWLRCQLWLADSSREPVIHSRAMWSWGTTLYHLTNRWLKRPRVSRSAAKFWPWTLRKSTPRAPRPKWVTHVYIKTQKNHRFHHVAEGNFLFLGWSDNFEGQQKPMVVQSGSNNQPRTARPKNVDEKPSTKALFTRNKPVRASLTEPTLSSRYCSSKV